MGRHSTYSGLELYSTVTLYHSRPPLEETACRVIYKLSLRRCKALSLPAVSGEAYTRVYNVALREDGLGLVLRTSFGLKPI